jgi:16S rRNA (guanine527-N7)-methyltransferase
VDPRLLARLSDGAAALGIVLDPGALEQLRAYAVELGVWNRRFNLTAIEDDAAIVDKHFLDSLSCARALDLTLSGAALDVGSGAGFPGLVLKIAFPHWQFVLLDSSEKRVRFLNRVIDRLGLTSVLAVHARAEEAAHRPAFREQFDAVLARAVARLNVLAEYTLPFARVGGRVVAQKGPEVAEEVAEAAPAIALLGGGSPSVDVFTLPQTHIHRSLVTIPKVRPTPPAYPRRPGSAKKHPLR